MKIPGLEKDASEVRTTLLSHISEMRSRLMKCLAVFVLVSCVALYFAGWIVKQMQRAGTDFEFIYISPTELMLEYFRISIICGIVVACPIIAYEIWKFVCPGLKAGEKKICFCLLTSGILLFFVGAVFCYYVVMPLALKFLYGLNVFGEIKAMVSIEKYLDFFIVMMTTFGVVFELPIVLVSLTLIGILNPNLLKDKQKYVIVAIFTIGAIITPPDVMSQLLVSFPMLGLYEISIVICMRIYQHKIAAQESALGI